MADAYETMELIRRKQQNSDSTTDNLFSTPKVTDTSPDWRSKNHMPGARGISDFLENDHIRNGTETGINSSQALPLK